MRTPEIELLWWEGCPSTERALKELREALADVGLQAAEIAVTEIKTDADAHRASFAGSPTILVDGVDVAGATPADSGDPARRGDPDQPPALSCRVYSRRDGTISPTPDPGDLRDALARAATDSEALPPAAAHVEVNR